MNFNKTLNHSAAHVLAAALSKMYPEVKLTIGPAIDEGFYYDFLLEENINISINDLPKIEKQMKKIISSAEPFEQFDLSKEEALNKYKNNKFKTEIINELNLQKYSFYKSGEFIDLCSGPHVSNVNKIKYFKLLNVAGSYWRGDSNNESLTRIYGIAFETEQELNDYLNLLEERKQRDHRKLGKDLKLFTFTNLTGQGLPIWLPNGTIIKKELEKYINKLQNKYEFSPVITPVLGSVDLYKTSGHWDHYKENMFPSMKIDNEELVLRPMTCPHHIMVYKNDLHSYRQLPIRLCEHSNLHRYESSGGLSGLERVRDMILEDTHIFCTQEQIKSEVKRCYEMIVEAQKKLGFQIYRVDLSLNDESNKEKYHGNAEMWSRAQTQLEEALNENGIEFQRMVGEAAFYGPKIDFQVKTILGRIITISTIQLDFLLPEKFELTYKSENGDFKRPVMIHLGLIGTYERFLAIIIEQTKGVLPFWLAPVQLTIIPVNEELHLDYCLNLKNELINNGLRVYLDDRNERLSKKIRESQVMKIPYQIVVGDEEIKNNNKITYREYGKEEVITISKMDFFKLINSKLN